MSQQSLHGNADLDVEAEEWVVRQQTVATGRAHEIPREGSRGGGVHAAQNGRRTVHKFIHVAADSIERHIVCHLHVIMVL